MIPLGGTALINASSEPELRELQRLSNNISVLIDSERTSEGVPLSKKREAFVEMCRNGLHMPCHVLDRRATENYFTDRAISIARVGNYPPSLGPYDVLADALKKYNWLVAREMTIEELEDTDLGQFLKDL
jgi:hypothetical protein